LYLYVRHNYPNIRAVWVTQNRDLYRNLKNEDIDVFLTYSLKGFLISLRAGSSFVSHGIRDINEFASRKTVLINLSHSTYPIKDMLTGAGITLFLTVVNYLRNPYWYLIKPDYAITSSAFTAKATRHQFQITDAQIVITGVPKTDFLVSSDPDSFEVFKTKDVLNFCSIGKKRILYVPTYRSERNFSIFNFGFDLEELCLVLTQCDAGMIFNLHPSESKQKLKMVPDFRKYECLQIGDFQGDEINLLLREVDLLITDYSAIFADFLVYNKPIIFANFDHQGYLNERKLYVDYDEDLPGPKAENWPELLKSIKDILYYENDEYEKERGELRNLIYPNLDGMARERIVEYVLSLSD